MTDGGKIRQAVTAALKDAQLLPRDAAGVALVERYAQTIDDSPGDPDVLAKLGPALLRALESLGLTPAGRGAKGGTGGTAPVASKLDELRARRAKRAGAN